MLTEERYSKILECLNEYKTVTVTQLAEALNASESTIRRDLNSLATMKKIINDLPPYRSHTILPV